VLKPLTAGCKADVKADRSGQAISGLELVEPSINTFSVTLQNYLQ